MLLKIIKPNQGRKQSSKDRSFIKIFPFTISKYHLISHQISPKSYFIAVSHVVEENVKNGGKHVRKSSDKIQGLQVMSFLPTF